MCDQSNCATCTACSALALEALAQAPAQAPLDRLFEATRVAMAKLYPEYAADLTRGDFSRTVDIFAADALSEKGLHNLPHRLSDEKLTAMLDEHLPTLFDGLSDSMIAFYKDKLKTARR